MNITFRPLLILAAACTIATACSEEDDSPADNIALEDKTGGEGDDAAGGDDENGAGNEEDRDSEEDGGKKEESDTTALANPCLTDERVYAKYPLLRNLNFVYPSHDPLGRPVMLSGTITMSRDLSPQTRAQGFILYNHYTVFRADECPSKGKLDMQNIIYLTAPHRNFITVSADYYGFGQTEDQMQAYCIATANARASIDALMAARALLADEGYTWDDDLLNVGYSQGAQTAIGVLKVAAEEYPGLSFTRTLAGGGPYDLEETYRQYLAAIGREGAWKNEYDKDIDEVGGLKVYRFPVERERDQKEFNKFSEKIASGHSSIAMQEKWMRLQGPCCPALIKWLEENRDNYDCFVFLTYLYYTTYFGLRAVGKKSILIPTAHDEWTIHLPLFQDMFKLPGAFFYNTTEEKELVNRLFDTKEIPDNAGFGGVGVEVPEKTDGDDFRSKYGIDDDFIIESEALFDKAVAAVADNPTALLHVRRARVDDNQRRIVRRRNQRADNRAGQATIVFRDVLQKFFGRIFQRAVFR